MEVINVTEWEISIARFDCRRILNCLTTTEIAVDCEFVL